MDRVLVPNFPISRVMKNPLLIVCLLFLVSPPVLYGQEKEAAKKGIFESREQYNEFFKRLSDLKDPEINKMLGPLNDVILSSHGLKKLPFGSPFQSERSWMIRLLDNEKVREEIELADFQFETIKKSSDQIADRMTQRIKKVLADQSEGEIDPERLKKDIKQIREQAESEFDKTLLPHQQKRLGQVLLHARLIREPLLKVITSDPIKDKIGIGPEQQQDLEQNWKEIDAKFKADVARLKAKAHAEFIKTLPKEQKAKYHELFGDQFDFTPKPKKKN